MLENWPHQIEPRDGEHELYSIAVSLKRIADALDKAPESLGNSIYAAIANARAS